MNIKSFPVNHSHPAYIEGYSSYNHTKECPYNINDKNDYRYYWYTGYYDSKYDKEHPEWNNVDTLKKKEIGTCEPGTK